MLDIDFIEKDKVFHVNTNEKFFLIPFLQKVDKSLEDCEFEIYFFYKEDYTENDIFQVYLGSTRIGWLFPMQVLASDSHEYFEDIHFQKYAFMAQKSLIKVLIKNGFFEHVDSIVNNDDYLKDNIFIFILSKKTISNKNFDNFRIESFFPSFFVHGLLPYDSNTIGSKNMEDSNKFKKKIAPFDTGKTKICIKAISADLKDDIFINLFLKKILPFQNDYLLDFFYAYQIIELLMDKVFQNEVKSTIEIINESFDSRLVIDAIHKFQDLTNEKRRINKIQSNYISSHIDTIELKKACQNLLDKYDKNSLNDINDNFTTYLYPIRNLIFHKYRVFQTSSELSEVVYLLNEFICNLLICFEIKAKQIEYHI